MPSTSAERDSLSKVPRTPLSYAHSQDTGMQQSQTTVRGQHQGVASWSMPRLKLTHPLPDYDCCQARYLWCLCKALSACVLTATMTSARNSTYSTHSVADTHLLAMLDGKQDIHGDDTQSSRLSAYFSTKLLETILIVPSTSSRKHGHELPGTQLSATSFDDMQRTVQVIGLPKPEKSKPSLKRSPESEHIIDDAAIDDPFRGHDYDSEPQMQYMSPSQESVAHAPEYRQYIMDMAEDIVVLSDRRRLTFREASDNEGTEEVIIMARVVVGMAEVVIQAAVRTTHHGQSSSGDMAVVAVAVVEGSQSGQSTRLTDGLEGLVQLILLGG
ncbi:hypothetical protein M438DRAFT_354484 [Aureobasidium pullulans EXF-150]|uniref:Uncharacterized protein n=1 Tax=Aureobasidium pullulans EXF-150 TaxID=1043002 RepID=A0A074YEX9_AURPU|nr:uncharacterized protein M438DRAFT_354484 [Aureobasidium pullulans EXF-150]KEQ85411.1 hypothetical protein M438DRAFT_354484 [Aureobasidium pullulans EXF-150]